MTPNPDHADDNPVTTVAPDQHQDQGEHVPDGDHDAFIHHPGLPVD